MKSILETIGSCPIVELSHSLVPSGKKLYLKLEQFNPNHSIKDRTALGLVLAALKSGHLAPGGTVIESTSGNLGKSLAMIGAAMGLKVIVVVDPKVSSTAVNWYKAYGAQVDMVNTPDGQGGYQRARIERVQQLLHEHPGAYWPNQYDNPQNPAYHDEVTAKEFARLDYDVLVGCVSTGGHLSGIARGIKRDRPQVKVLACDVLGSAALGGAFSPYLLNGVGLAWRSANTHLDCFDYHSLIDDHHAISMCRILARESGLLLGGSAGLVAYGALQCLYGSSAKSVLAIMPDSGTNYLDTLYDDRWLEQKNIHLYGVEALRQDLQANEFKRSRSGRDLESVPSLSY
ncbi:pyridoxal-phosphate dependent enzyme [Pseudomonas chlororaphis]|uniref:pyridoxal-phosphate dependent enzyme n=1 Tax=Pseudomonas chlororaphis TaxID=587753 RepID=UPI0006A57B69|nr:pyridoxal-phosphate dependent enzyme [Pseudomonas chlororaphis]AZC31708.1 Cysteine synthase [Pseudomonas chlororaphis subsp. piscium]MBP5077264.1 pyridoxal-phosphate dependent enzyme [Pseudomonas chlororaphis]QTT88478.1 pyridoxal-phosphate dependent enzyme [Pseudomonas chlororaphis]WDG77734.1 pyridoxal-phosphate dependent enzyme [Pseudomonas chlororaphis]WDG83029.1 pyridoxal-phosphate dependent enzyme [Pseudomonas chlororaphis]